MNVFSCTQAKREFRKILNLAEQNEMAIITRYGKPVAMMIPVQDMSLEVLQSHLAQWSLYKQGLQAQVYDDAHPEELNDWQHTIADGLDSDEVFNQEKLDRLTK